MLKDSLREIVEVNNNTASRFFDIFIQVLIILSIASFSIETIPDLDSDMQKALNYFEVFTVIVFTIEYLVRIYVAKKRLSYIFSFFGIIDLLAILPFYLAFAVDLRTLKILRLLRLFRILKLARYNKTLNRFQRAISESKEEFILFFTITLMLFYLSSVGIYYFEHEAQPKIFSSIFASMWWAVATLTTVGYGDVYPVTVGGKIFTTFILLIGLGVVSIPAGIISSALTHIDNEDRDKIPIEE